MAPIKTSTLGNSRVAGINEASTRACTPHADVSAPLAIAPHRRHPGCHLGSHLGLHLEPARGPARAQGFTLLEVLLVVVLIALSYTLLPRMFGSGVFIGAIAAFLAVCAERNQLERTTRFAR